MEDEGKKRSFFKKLRNYFFAGVVVLIPIGITLYLTVFLVSISTNILPNDGGLIVADAFDAEILRFPEAKSLNAARRKKLIHKFGRDAAMRLRSLRDPDFPYGY